jgi:hypothetical protein
MNGIENPGLTIENNENQNKNLSISPIEIERNKKMSPLMLFSLTFHSLGIIFGDM